MSIKHLTQLVFSSVCQLPMLHLPTFSKPHNRQGLFETLTFGPWSDSTLALQGQAGLNQTVEGPSRWAALAGAIEFSRSMPISNFGTSNLGTLALFGSIGWGSTARAHCRRKDARSLPAMAVLLKLVSWRGCGCGRHGRQTGTWSFRPIHE